ncbi:MAG: hypothetical protein JWP91_3784 [Fibrobacteres bacterium]|nr:hypothetical protein [Fibrobacterota bacterium]
MIPENLIINADDFGLDARVSRAISLCLDEGLINSFSVFPFWDDYHAALLASILARHPRVRVGAHLALVGSAKEENPNHYRDFLRRYLTGKIDAANVRAIWKAQIEDLGVHLAHAGGVARIAHLDSHQHLHVLPGLWQAARSLQEEFSVPRLRVPYESLARSWGYRFPFGLGMQFLARRRVTPSTPRFLGFFSSTRFTFEANREGLAAVRGDTERRYELMVHPALPREGGQAEDGVQVAASQEAEVGELRKLKAFLESGGL